MSSKGEDNNTGVLCGRRFRLMLRCVEENASSVACTDRIDDFLACQRAVLLASIRERSHSAGIKTSGPSIARGTAEEDSSLHSMLENKNSGTESKVMHARREASDPGDDFLRPFSDLASICSRAVAKQTDACSKLVDTALKRESAPSFFAFGQRMVVDVGRTLSLVKDWTTNIVKQLWDGTDKPKR